MQLDTIANALTDQISKQVPVTTAPEIAEACDIDRRRVNEGLRLLQRNGEAECKRAGARAYVWWPTPHPWRQGGPTTTPTSDIERAVHDWDPGRNQRERERRRENGREILEWLQNQGTSVQKQDFIAALYPTYADGDADADAWWRRQVRPLLNIAVENGVVTKNGRKWRWDGDS